MDWSRADFETVREVVREGELYLQGQVSLATSADQRASVMTSVFTAAGAAIMGGIAVLVGTDHVARFGPLLVGAGISTVMFLAGSGFCVCAALPAAFDLPGSQPESWRDDIQQGRPLGDSLSQQAEHYQSKIADNRNVLQSNATLFRRGAVLGILAPIAGGVAGAIVSIWL